MSGWRGETLAADDMPPALPATLALAVPMHIAELRGLPAGQLVEIARGCADVVAGEGDVLVFRSSKKGGTARVFNALARGLAALAYAWGGVDFAGLHWEVEDSPLRPDGMADELVDLAGATARIATVAATGGRL